MYKLYILVEVTRLVAASQALLLLDQGFSAIVPVLPSQIYHVGLIFAVASTITAVVPVAYAQYANTSAPSNSSASFGKIGDHFDCDNH